MCFTHVGSSTPCGKAQLCLTCSRLMDRMILVLCHTLNNRGHACTSDAAEKASPVQVRCHAVSLVCPAVCFPPMPHGPLCQLLPLACSGASCCPQGQPSETCSIARPTARAMHSSRRSAGVSAISEVVCNTYVFN